MNLDRRLPAGLGAALALLVGSRAVAQPLPPPATEQPASPATATAAEAAPASVPSSEALETPYGDPSPPAPPAAPPVASTSPVKVITPQPGADERPLGPIRAQRRLALLGELGWNGLAGFGAILTYNANPHLAFDLGGGFSLLGWKAGARARYNLLTGNMTPFVGFGANATSGLGEITDPGDERRGPESVPFTLDIKPSYLLQYTVGFDFLHRRGFNMLGAIGYAQLLNKHNIIVVDGSLTSDERQAINAIFKGGVVISLAAGYAFE